MIYCILHIAEEKHQYIKCIRIFTIKAVIGKLIFCVIIT